MGKRTARDVMTTEIQTVGPDSSLEDIAQLLVAHHISSVPVVDGERRVLGMVSEADLIDEHKRKARIPRTALFGLVPLPDDVLWEAARRGTVLTAVDLMTRRTVTATEETPVREVADLMVRHRINHIPVTREGRLVGIVARADLVRELVRSEPENE